MTVRPHGGCMTQPIGRWMVSGKFVPRTQSPSATTITTKNNDKRYDINEGTQRRPRENWWWLDGTACYASFEVLAQACRMDTGGGGTPSLVWHWIKGNPTSDDGRGLPCRVGHVRRLDLRANFSA